MIVNFLLFCIIGFIPYVAAYIGLKIEWATSKKYLPKILLYFLLYATFKLFAVALVIPEVEHSTVATFIFTLVTNSFEFVPFFYLIKNNKAYSKTPAVTFWWSVFSVAVSCFFNFVSNSRTYELEAQHVVYAFSAISHFFTMLAAEKIFHAIPKKHSIFDLKGRMQFLVLLLGLPAALGSIGAAAPECVSEIMNTGASFLLYFISRGIVYSD